MSRQETTALSTLSTPTATATPVGAAPNPFVMVQDRLQNRWRVCLFVGLLLGAALATTAYFSAPVKYAASSYVKIDAKLDTILDEEMPERAKMDNYEAYVAQQIVLINDPRVFEAVADAARRGEPTARAKAERQTEAAGEAAVVKRFFERHGLEKGIEVLSEGLVVTSPRGSSMIEIRFESADQTLPAPMANWVTDAYLDIYGPSAETVYSRKIASLRELMALARRDSAKYVEERIAVLKDTPYGSANLAALVEERVGKLREIDEKLVRNRSLQKDITRQWEETQLAKGEDAALPVPEDMRLEPTMAELDAIDPSLVERRRSLEAARVRLEGLPRTYRNGHRIYQTSAREVEDLTAQLDAARRGARAMWAEGSARELSHGALRKQEARDVAEQQSLRAEVDQANMLMARLAETDRRIEETRSAEQSFAARINELEREQDSIRRGRIGVARAASQMPTPASDKRAQFAALGLLGGFGLSFAAFFVIGTISPRAFRASQLANDAHGLNWLGVVPDMTNAASESFVYELSINCIDRLRNKVEARRTPGDGYAMMVTSPTQGDGKTTIALALAISYARAGHRTVVVDCDFIGRAMSGMLGMLHAPGVREVIRRGSLENEVVEAQHGVSLLPVGIDASISASNLQVGAMRRLLRTLRDRFDIIIVDAGPVTASVEAIPVAASCDGAMLVLRRGRSRSRIAESVGEIRSAGAEYLGLILNDAEQADCIRYGSISKMSTEVAQAIERGTATSSRHPLLGAGAVDGKGDSGSRKGAA
jgi:polysaccharide biosynthesis transport protein